MRIDELQRVLRAETNIKEHVWAIEPESVPDGVLGLKKTEDGRWRVILNERGLHLINRTFQNESDACRFFLKSVLDDDDFWTAAPIVGDNPYAAHMTRHIELLRKYGFERGEGDTHFGYLVMFAILFMGISMAPLYVSVHCSFCALVAVLAYFLGWFLVVFSPLVSRHARFLNYRFGWGTVGQAYLVIFIAGGIVALFYGWALIRFAPTLLCSG